MLAKLDYFKQTIRLQNISQDTRAKHATKNCAIKGEDASFHALCHILKPFLQPPKNSESLAKKESGGIGSQFGGRISGPTEVAESAVPEVKKDGKLHHQRDPSVIRSEAQLLLLHDQ